MNSDEKAEAIGLSKSGQMSGVPWGVGDIDGGEPGFFVRGQPAGNTYHVIYLIDRSGSMGQGGKMGLLRNQLLLSISRLKSTQDFHVIMFSGQRGELPRENSPRRLTPANYEHKLIAAEFIDGIGEAEGNTVAASALERAFTVLENADSQRQGKLIYLLTDGQLGDRDEVFKVLAERNELKSVQINTLLLSEDEDSGAAQTLRRIAKESGGRYKHISPDEVH